jgi:hypothetical protein
MMKRFVVRWTCQRTFLQGCGLPDEVIAVFESLGSLIRFYSCFISYSSVDQQMADRLYRDLLGQGVRCWLATEDLRIGDRFRQTIDEAIKLHDKLLLILSVASVQSRWVESEVESALERERRTDQLVLFPITIDDAVFETNAAWTAEIRRTRHVGDFRRWKEHDEYIQNFYRLVRDLKSDKPLRDAIDAR